jgi:hypothetical protein
MRKESTAKLRRQRRGLLRRLGSMEPKVLRGSVIERYKRCGKPGCKCAQGRGHGPKYYLSVSRAGQRPEMVYVAKEYVKEVEHKVENLQGFRAVLEALCEINRELLKRREEF